MEKLPPSEDSPLNGQETSKYHHHHLSNDGKLRRQIFRRWVIGGTLTCLVLILILGNVPEKVNFFGSGKDASDTDDDAESDENLGVMIAFVGNSMFYFNGA